MMEEKFYTDSQISDALRFVDRSDGWECTVERVVNHLYPKTHAVEVDLRARVKQMILMKLS